jgi:hypothetical protein
MAATPQAGVDGPTCAWDVTDAVLCGPVQDQPRATHFIMREHQDDCLQLALTY